MRSTLATVLTAMACGAAAAQSLEVHLTHAEPGGALRAGALYTATPINGWLYFDLAFEPFVRGDLRHRDIYLVGPEGTRFPLPDRQTYRANREVIRGVFGTIATSDAAGVFPISRQFSVKCTDTFPHRGPREVASARRDCERYSVLLGAGRIPLSRGTAVMAELLFEAPDEGWAAGDYTLTIDGPGDSMTQLPVTIGQEPAP